MDEKKLEDQLKKIWDETPISHSDKEKEVSWEEFQSKAFVSKKKQNKFWRYYAAAAVLIFVFLGTALYFNNDITNTNTTLAETTVKNATSILKIIVLPDSSRVELSPNSKIVYASNFALNRKVQLIGEAYFKVTKDKKHPFQVFCNETSTTVLGTSFIVKGYTQKEVSVELYEGSVEMSVKNQTKKWILKPGEKFTYGNETAVVAGFDRFVDFDNENLSAVSTYIESNYGYKVTIPQQYDNQKITVRINKKEDLTTIVQLIAEMYNLNFEINEKVKQITFQ
ncbi:FecR family protein [Flavobacterium araucananum]|jgi:transmembrane sensor|uniref:Iron dicitrate transport regulator FecR n=1 Tax=Flavobacterium araucananum TaxID=946678 RepID=A0A227PIQ9_9FLAO|nr:FecR family protein [Flavobacterium araucananum]OXG09158.1 iron dicitrate transport regulator FecR [Flavobacterium araucananum]PWJ99645.1 FecR family protein [Flavobacterium araucananum]